MHLTEGRNTGFRKIRNVLKTNGSPEPLFETDDERTYFSTTRYIHDKFIAPQNRKAINEAINLTANEIRIRDYVALHPRATIKEVVAALSITKSSVDRAIKSLSDKGIVERTGANKNRIWEILK